MTKGTSPDSCCQYPSPSSEPLLNHASTGDPPTLAGSFGSISCGATAPFLWVFVHTGFCLCPSSLESLFSPVLWKSCNQILLGFKVRFPGDSQSLCWIPRLGSLMWGSEPSQQWENFFGFTVLQFVGHPPSRYGIWFYCDFIPPTISLWLLLCLWMRGIFFWCVPVFSSWWLFSNCDFSALSGGAECVSSYCAILNQSLSGILLTKVFWLNQQRTFVSCIECAFPFTLGWPEYTDTSKKKWLYLIKKEPRVVQ